MSFRITSSSLTAPRARVVSYALGTLKIYIERVIE